MTTNMPASRNGRTWYVVRTASQRSAAAKTTRPTVTMAQKTVSAIAASVVEAPSSLVVRRDAERLEHCEPRVSRVRANIRGAEGGRGRLILPG
jgi:hypothetical protein